MTEKTEMTESMRRVVAWAPAAGYMLLIWALSSMTLSVNFERVPFKDKGIHFAEYGTLAVLLSHALRGTWRHWRPFLTFAVAVALTILWGITDEIHQAYVPGRNSDVHDVMADALGALAGAGFYWVVREQWRARLSR